MSHTPVVPNATGAHLTITAEELFELRHVARGTKRPTLIIRHGSIVAVHTGEILQRDIIINGRHIAAVTPWDYFPTSKYASDPHIEEVDATGKYISPGFIDTHIHIEYTKLVPGELARLSVPRGTTTVLADANCIANVLGGRGMDFMGTTSTPLRIFRQVSHKVPMSGPNIELGGTSLSTSEICHRVSACEAATLGESNPFSLDMASAQKQAAALQAGKRITGHSALLVNEPLWAYCAGGIGDDHNAHRPDDVIERLRLGMMLTVMSGSMNSNIEPVFSNFALYKDGLRFISFCADDKYCEDLDTTGHVDLHVRRAVELGVPVLEAYKMATINAASYYRLDHLIGSVTPGKLADLLILDRLEDARPSLVIGNGSIVAKDNKALFTNSDIVPDFTLNTIHLNECHFDKASYHLYPSDRSNPKAWVQCVEMYDGYFKRAFHYQLPVSPEEPHNILCDTDHDVLKVVIIDRHHGTANRGIAFVRGFGLKRGAIATTTNCENQNLVVIGADDESIAAAVLAMQLLGGGMLAVSGQGHQVLGTVKLDVAGCMSSAPWEEVRDQSLRLEELVRENLGCTMEQNPFLIASFVGLVAVPDLGLTELGLVVGGGETLMNPVLETEPLQNQPNLDPTQRTASDYQATPDFTSVSNVSDVFITAFRRIQIQNVKMRLNLRVFLLLVALASPIAAQRRRIQPQPVMVDGAVNEADVEVSEEAMIESVIPSSAPVTIAAPRPLATAPAKPILPITALLYSSSPGPKECRGTPVFSLNLPKGPGVATPKGPTCYNVTAASQAECGTFMANMEDGCQARVFGELGCQSFTNLAVFMEELRPVGGIIRSIEVTCGIQSTQPAPLNLNLPAAKKKKPAGG
ncbi:hypothetical protein JX266_005309 [Neoarthrinium moseri]|nr:hypothetical protein JX266_005309 [Neoarthrinium moseri]